MFSFHSGVKAKGGAYLNGTATFALAFTKFMPANERAQHVQTQKSRHTIAKDDGIAPKAMLAIAKKYIQNETIFSRISHSELDKTYEA